MIEFLLKNFHQTKCLFPGPTVHFIYTHANGYNRFKYGLKANTEISYFIFTALKKAFRKVRFLRLSGEETAKIDAIAPNDVVVGHIGETYLRASQKTRRLIAFHPWAGHDDRSDNTLYNCLSKEEELSYWEKAATLVLLTSEFNVTKYVKCPTNMWHTYFGQEKKRVRFVHQPLDLARFPRIKHSYSSGDFLYVGNDAHMKCLKDSKSLVAKVGKKIHIYGVGKERLDNLDRSQLNRLAEQSDFFIQPGMWEAQCVSILEAAARGFIPIVSPETGYPYDHPFLLRWDDFSYNLSILQHLLALPPVEKKAIGDVLHEKLVKDVNHNNWNILTDVIVDEVKRIL